MPLESLITNLKRSLPTIRNEKYCFFDSEYNVGVNVKTNKMREDGTVLVMLLLLFVFIQVISSHIDTVDNNWKRNPHLNSMIINYFTKSPFMYSRLLSN